VISKSLPLRLTRRQRMSGGSMNDSVVESLLSQLGRCGRRLLQSQGSLWGRPEMFTFVKGCRMFIVLDNSRPPHSRQTRRHRFGTRRFVNSFPLMPWTKKSLTATKTPCLFLWRTARGKVDRVESMAEAPCSFYIWREKKICSSSQHCQFPSSLDQGLLSVLVLMKVYASSCRYSFLEARFRWSLTRGKWERGNRFGELPVKDSKSVV
jgi:hypothetical protein